ncbi:sodium/hydrogen exchanger 3 [Saprolegnia parasitica CBS 223.65]|uniref:Sodium/hydrogen exchanger n=1 Tax=Saprolegnia parasitica (strain CBS 223.65) TaxID=695850 RepID=A0A067BLG2_SAPPC|nr:sodium/hydrogen exchanger 3 [Saprolegnia parasitica CBS 223.65]KDO19053.1 sodium/hydrogen exchanger 3 [Saprolegnia parasitica CBS 223.65]|eukprot:XP_012210241.1 sodium/hydrogen exchanger 3 [Saprolegnia parasitica CBS 223.65]
MEEGSMAMAPAEIMLDAVRAEEAWTGVELLVCAVLQLLLVFLGYRLDRATTHTMMIPESAYAIVFGLCFGAVLKFCTPVDKIGLNPQVLFFGLLPPIILEAGFSMKKRGFFTNFSTILLLAIVGTLVATFITGGLLIWLGQLGLITALTPAEAYLYGSLISAVDPVATLSVFKKNDAPPMLFNLVFGESVLNDGVAIVVFTLFQEFIRHGISDVDHHAAFMVVLKVIAIGIGSVALAAAVCFISAFMLKIADPMLQQYPHYEISIVLLSAYISYVVGDLAGLSGIVALFFSGVLMSHYHLTNMSQESATALKHLLSTLAFLAENFIFLYLGVSVVAYSSSFKWDWRFLILQLLVLLLARAANTFPLCALANLGRKDAIPFSHMVVIWFSGLRGAIAFALALNVYTPDESHAGVIKSSTLFTVMFTTLVFGVSTGPLLTYVGLGKRNASSPYLRPEAVKLLDEVHECGGDPISPTAETGMHGIWNDVDAKYLMPVFGNQRHDSESIHPTAASRSSSGSSDYERP